MREFTSVKNSIEMKLNGSVYTAEPLKILKMSAEYDEKSPDMRQEIARQKYSKESVLIFLQFMVSIIDDALGDGSVQAILGESVDYYSIMDLYVFICESFREFDKAKSKEYSA